MNRRLRKDTVIENLADTEMKFKSEEHLDLSKLQQLPSYYYVLARYHTLKLQLKDKASIALLLDSLLMN